jgi:hypothetical protein
LIGIDGGDEEAFGGHGVAWMIWGGDMLIA